MAIDTLKIIETAETIPSRISKYLSYGFIILGIVLFALAFFGMNQHFLIGKYDQPILSWMVDSRTQFVTEIAKMLTNLGGALVLACVSAFIAIVWFIIKRELWRPVLLVASMIVASGTSVILKILIMDPRPAQTNMIPTFETDYSFPSGHTLATIVFLLVLGYLIYSRTFSKARVTAWLIIALIGSSLIGLTRLYLGYHWLTDVIASIGLGFIIVGIAILVDRIYLSRKYLE